MWSIKSWLIESLVEILKKQSLVCLWHQCHKQNGRPPETNKEVEAHLSTWHSLIETVQCMASQSVISPCHRDHDINQASQDYLKKWEQTKSYMSSDAAIFFIALDVYFMQCVWREHWKICSQWTCVGVFGITTSFSMVRAGMAWRQSVSRRLWVEQQSQFQDRVITASVKKALVVQGMSVILSLTLPVRPHNMAWCQIVASFQYVGYLKGKLKNERVRLSLQFQHRLLQNLLLHTSSWGIYPSYWQLVCPSRLMNLPHFMCPYF